MIPYGKLFFVCIEPCVFSQMRAKLKSPKGARHIHNKDRVEHCRTVARWQLPTGQFT